MCPTLGLEQTHYSQYTLLGRNSGVFIIKGGGGESQNRLPNRIPHIESSGVTSPICFVITDPW